MLKKSQKVKLQKEFTRAAAYAAEYQGVTAISHLFNTRLRRVSELMNGFETGSILDLGCGPAFIGDQFLESDIHYYGLDLSPDMLKECVRHYKGKSGFHFLLGNMEAIPFPDNSFETILCLGSLEYIMDLDAVFQEVNRVLKTGGVFIATMQNPVSPYRLWKRWVYLKTKNLLGKFKIVFKSEKKAQNTESDASMFFKMYSASEFRSALIKNNLQIKDLLYYDFNIFLSPLDDMFSYLSVHVSRKLESLARGKLRFLGSGYIYKCEKII